MGKISSPDIINKNFRINEMANSGSDEKCKNITKKNENLDDKNEDQCSAENSFLKDGKIIESTLRSTPVLDKNVLKDQDSQGDDAEDKNKRTKNDKLDENRNNEGIEEENKSASSSAKSERPLDLSVTKDEEEEVENL